MSIAPERTVKDPTRTPAQFEVASEGEGYIVIDTQSGREVVTPRRYTMAANACARLNDAAHLGSRGLESVFELLGAVDG